MIDDELEVMLGDIEATFGASITVRVISEGTFTASTGTRVEGVTDSTVLAWRSARRGERSADAEVTAVEYRIRVSQLATLRRGFKIVDGAQTFWVHRAEKEVNDLLWVAYCRSVKPPG